MPQTTEQAAIASKVIHVIEVSAPHLNPSFVVGMAWQETGNYTEHGIQLRVAVIAADPVDAIMAIEDCAMRPHGSLRLHRMTVGMSDELARTAWQGDATIIPTPKRRGWIASSFSS